MFCLEIYHGGTSLNRLSLVASTYTCRGAGGGAGVLSSPEPRRPLTPYSITISIALPNLDEISSQISVISVFGWLPFFGGQKHIKRFDPDLRGLQSFDK